MEARIAVLLVVAMLTLGCTGQQIEPATDDGSNGTAPAGNGSDQAREDEGDDRASEPGNGSGVPEDAENASANLTRQQLEDGRIHLTQEGPGWQATRLVVTPDIWEGEWGDDGGGVSISLVLEPSMRSAEESLLGLGFRMPSSFEDGGEPWTTLSFYATNEQTPPLGFWISLSCSGDGCKDAPPRLEFVFIHGTAGGSANLSVGVPGEGEGPSEAGIADREAIDWPTEHAGEHIAGGTHLSVEAAGSPLSPPVHLEWTAGAITVEDEAPTPRPAGVQAAAHHRMAAEAALPANGTTTARFGALESVEATAWTAEWSMPSTTGAETGAWTRAGYLSAGFMPLWAAYQEHDAGDLSLLLERTSSGKQGPGIAGDQGIPLAARVVLGAWGFFDATLEEMYGWEVDEYAASSSPIPQPAGSHPAMDATAKLCPASFDGPCLLETPRGADRGSG